MQELGRRTQIVKEKREMEQSSNEKYIHPDNRESTYANICHDLLWMISLVPVEKPELQLPGICDIVIILHQDLVTMSWAILIFIAIPCMFWSEHQVWARSRCNYFVSNNAKLRRT